MGRDYKDCAKSCLIVCCETWTKTMEKTVGIDKKHDQQESHSASQCDKLTIMAEDMSWELEFVA
jgi:hypothetical protein